MVAFIGTIAAAALAIVGALWAAKWAAAGTVEAATISAESAGKAASVQRDNDDRHCFTSRKQEFYVGLWQAADRLKRECEQHQAWRVDQVNDVPGAEPKLNDSEPVRQAWKALEILAPGVPATRAQALYQATVSLHEILWVDPFDLVGEEAINDPIPDAEWHQAIAFWDGIAAAFLDAAAADLLNPTTLDPAGPAS